jgi:glutaryl-CoA dehydrogenase
MEPGAVSRQRAGQRPAAPRRAADADLLLLEGRDLLGGDGLLLGNHVVRHLLDMEGVATHEGTQSINAVIVGRAITGPSALSR